MILRLLSRWRRPCLRPTWRRFSTQPQIQSRPQTLSKVPERMEPSPFSPIPPQNPRSLPLVFASGTLISALAVAVYISKSDRPPSKSDSFYADLEETLAKSKNSVRRIFDQMSQTAAAASVLWKSLESLMSVANQEVRSGFELRVAALIADIAAASGARRSAIVGAGGGAVVDWLLESVAAKGKDRSGTREEAARALAYLVADPGVCENVLGRPGAVPNLLRFIFSFQPKNGEKPIKFSSSDNSSLCKGRSMLVAALMDIVTSNCETTDYSAYQSLLPNNADMRDIAAALEVVEEGGMHLDDQHGDKEDADGDRGMKGIGIKVLGGTSILGCVRTNGVSETDDVHMESTSHISRNVASQENKGRSLKLGNLASVTVPGLWDDLQREHVAVPFAAWALANWALASKDNRSHIQELDRDGHAIMTALMAPERTVKWHGSLVARALLDDQNLPLTVSVPGWSSSLLSTAFHASKVGDISLAQVALSAFLISVERSDDAKGAVIDKGLHLMREIAKHTERHKNLQESLARVLELLYTGGMHLSLDEGQRWSGILLRWVFGAFSSDAARVSARKILSFILEDYGPASITISQGWLAILLYEVIGASKKSTLKGSSTLKTDTVKTQIDQSNALSATQVVNQLATAVLKMASNQLDADSDSFDRLPIADFLSVEPFAALVKNTNKNNLAKIDAADSAFATLKSVKALSELCSEDAACQNKIADLGILCLLRRLLLNDDYEKLAAIETYDASRALEMQDRGSTVSSSLDSTDPSVRVPPTAHIRKHAARLLRILSLSPKVKKVIAADENLCKWLEDCASGKISCCNDLKTQSNARATLLNVLCSDQTDPKTVTDGHSSMEGRKTKCVQYEEMIFLINPELPHWKCPDSNDLGISKDLTAARKPVSPNSSSSSYGHESFVSENSNTSSCIDSSDSVSDSPLLDVIFIHGLRGGPFKSWRIADDKSSTTSKSGLVENIDQEAGKEGTCWPREWLSDDFPYARLFTVKYKTNLTQWSGASLPLQEVSSMLLQKLVAAGIGDRPVVFITHSMGGLVVKQMLYEAKINNFSKFVNNTIGVVFYSCPHFGSKLADMPWRMGMVFRPAPTIGELRSGSPRLVELNDFIRHLNRKGLLEVLSFSETLVTPIVEGYGGWAFRMEIVPIESAYPGFGELVVLDATDHINSCKPVNRSDPSYAETLEFLQKLKARLS